MPPKLDPKKIEADRLLGFLQELLREEENKYCADCESKQPRWASWNLGVFLCIRCAGLHRNLGVHISKVKSVNLDSWTAEQVQSMRVMGNAKAKAVYEAELPQMFRRPQSDQTLEAFIRAKYESRRYILRDWQPPPVSAADLPERAGLGQPKSAAKPQLSSANALPMPKLSPKSQETKSTPAAAQSSLLIDFSASAESASGPPPAAAIATGLDSSIFGQPLVGPTAGGVDETAPTGGGDLDDLIYGPIVSAPSAPPSVGAPSNTATAFDLLEQGNTNNNGPPLQNKKKSKDEILALFCSSRPPTIAPTENGGVGFMVQSFGAQFQQHPQSVSPQAAFAYGHAQPQFVGQMPMTYGSKVPQPSANATVASGGPPMFVNFGAPSTSTTAGGLDDLLGQFKL